MKRYSSAFRRRLGLVREAMKTGRALLCLHVFCFAFSLPLLLLLSPARLRTLLEPPSRARRHPREDRQSVSATVLAILQAGRPLIRTGCMIRGVTLYYFLRRAGVDVALCFGIGRVPVGDGFDGHCWLSYEGEPYLEARDPRPIYTEMTVFRGPATLGPIG